MNAHTPSVRRTPLRTIRRTVSLSTVTLGILLLSIGMSACVQSDAKNVMAAERESQTNSVDEYLQGAWVVDGAKYFERALDAAPPKFIQELVRIRTMGYVIDADTIEYWITTPSDQRTARAQYAIVAQDAQSVDIRWVDGEKNDRAKEIFGQAEALRFTFVDKDNAELLAVFDEDGAADQEQDFRPSIPLYRVDSEEFEEHFHATAPAIEDDEVAAYLRGAWVLDTDATVARLPEEERSMNGMGTRLTPLTFRFYAQDRVHAEELGHTRTDSMDAIYRVVRSEEGLRLEFWATDGERVVDTEPMTVAYVEIIDADRVSITPAYSYSATDPLPNRVFRRVDDATREAYRETPPNVGQLDDAEREHFTEYLRGAWVSNTKKTLAKHASHGRGGVTSAEELGRMGMEFKEDHTLRIQFSGQHDREVSEAKYTLLDAQENVLIIGVMRPQDSRAEEFVLVLDGDDQLQLKPASGEHRTQAEADGQTIVFERVSPKTLEKILTEEEERADNSKE